MKLVKVSALVAAVLVSSVFAAPVQWTSAAGGNDHWYDVVANLGVTGGPADIGGMPHAAMPWVAPSWVERLSGDCNQRSRKCLHRQFIR